MKLPPNFAIVIWDDAASPPATQVVDVTNAQELGKVHQHTAIATAGWVLRDDAAGVTMAGEYCSDNDFRGCTFIPRALIREMRPGRCGAVRRRRPTVLPTEEAP